MYSMTLTIVFFQLFCQTALSDLRFSPFFSWSITTASLCSYFVRNKQHALSCSSTPSTYPSPALLKNRCVCVTYLRGTLIRQLQTAYHQPIWKWDYYAWYDFTVGVCLSTCILNACTFLCSSPVLLFFVWLVGFFVKAWTQMQQFHLVLPFLLVIF